MDWKVSKASPGCSVCGADLGEEEFISALRDNGIDFDRVDFCLACWEETRKEDLFSYWRTRHVREEKARPRVRYVDSDTLLELFRKLAANPAGKEIFAFLLGMVLVQKRILRYLRVASRGEAEVVVLLHGKSGDEFEIPNPDVTEEELARAKASFAEILDTDGESPDEVDEGGF